MNVVSARNLSKTFKTRVATDKGWENKEVRAVSGVTLDIKNGETLALVGESGCGKTTLGRMMALLYQPTSGELDIEGKTVNGLSRRQLKPLRRNVQMIFQDPVAALNPRHTVEYILTEPLNIFSVGTIEERKARVLDLVEVVGLAASDLKRYPHEFSGGQRQRITIARALSLNPHFVVADEPVSALDVSVQSQILNLLKDLRDKLDLTYLFISHDMAVVHHLADRVAVMYLGSIVEITTREKLFADPGHPYSRALLASVPTLHAGKARLGRILQGDPPSPIHPPAGCPFNPRCEYANDTCRKEVPRLENYRNNQNHQIACHLKEVI
jgi:oligopeptide transport system ATP-binding protein